MTTAYWRGREFKVEAHARGRTWRVRIKESRGEAQQRVEAALLAGAS